MSDRDTPPFADLLRDGGGCGLLIAARDWTSRGLGPIESWSASLRTATLMLLHSPVPMKLCSYVPASYVSQKLAGRMVAL